jgi:hypothetical protein
VKVIFGILFFCLFAFGVYTFIRNPAWITDSEHIAAIGVGMGWGFFLRGFME